MNNINALIVDDEKPAREKIRTFLKEESFISSIFEAKNGVEAVEMIKQGKADIVFLDIQMPGMNGFEVIEKVGAENMPIIVFVTAYDEYAIQAFEVQAVDYLLKPFDQKRFRKSLNRALEQKELKNKNVFVIKKLLEEIKKEREYLRKILVKKGQSSFFVDTDEIVYIAAEKEYITLYTEKESHLVRETMKRMERHLNPAKFARVHRSFIVNIDYIKEIQPWFHGDKIIVMKNGKELKLSRRFRDRLFKLNDKF
jgi:two-component system LytT family response regulator